MQGNVLNEDAIALLNSETGMSTVFSSLDEGTDFILAVLLSNSFGDTTFVMKNASTKGYFAEDFDRTKEMNDFLGAFPGHGKRIGRQQQQRGRLSCGHYPSE